MIPMLDIDCPPDRPVLRLVRRFEAPPALVWRAWTEPQALRRWFGPDGGPVHVAEVDLRVGGRFRVAFETMEGERHEVGGTYTEVRQEARLAFSWSWISTPDRVSRVSLDFKEVDDGTELSLLHEAFFDLAARDRHVRGWTGSLVKLDAFLRHP